MMKLRIVVSVDRSVATGSVLPGAIPIVMATKRIRQSVRRGLITVSLSEEPVGDGAIGPAIVAQELALFEREFVA